MPRRTTSYKGHVETHAQLIMPGYYLDRNIVVTLIYCLYITGDITELVMFYLNATEHSYIR